MGHLLFLFVQTLFFSTLALSQNQNFYDSDPHIIELTPRNFDRVVYGTNHTTLVEFYAPWCGYCKQLKPKYHKAAKRLDGIVQVASVNCDLAKNKQICSEQGVQGFPTVKVFKPPKGHSGKRSSNFKGVLYQGERETKAIVNFVLAYVRNSVSKLGKDPAALKKLLQREKYLGILLSKSETVSASYKAVALDWMGKVKFAMIPFTKIDTDKFFKASSFKDSKHSDLLDSLRIIVEELKQSGSKSNKFIVLDMDRGAIETLDDESIKRTTVSKFLSKITGDTPNEGPLSKRQEYIDSLKRGKSKEERKSKAKNGRKKNRDEL